MTAKSRTAAAITAKQTADSFNLLAQAALTLAARLEDRFSGMSEMDWKWSARNITIPEFLREIGAVILEVKPWEPDLACVSKPVRPPSATFYALMLGQPTAPQVSMALPEPDVTMREFIHSLRQKAAFTMERGESILGNRASAEFPRFVIDYSNGSYSREQQREFHAAGSRLFGRENWEVARKTLGLAVTGQPTSTSFSAGQMNALYESIKAELDAGATGENDVFPMVGRILNASGIKG